MNDQLYGREVVRPVARTVTPTAPARPTDVVPTGDRATVFPETRRDTAVEDRVMEVVDGIGKAIGRATGYVRSRPRADMRADAENLIAGRPLLVLGAALGLGYLVGRQIRR